MKYLIILLLIFSSCNSKHSKNTHYENEINEKKLTKYQEDSVFKMKHLSGLFNSLNEPNLSDLEYECCRFTLQKSFGNSIIFRLDKKGDEYHKLVVKEYKSASTEENPREVLLLNEMTYDLSISEFEDFKSLLNQSYFWTLKYWDERFGFDGNTYTLEGLVPYTWDKDEKVYHCVTRWQPYEGSFKQACEKLVEFYNVQLKKQNMLQYQL